MSKFNKGKQMQLFYMLQMLIEGSENVKILNFLDIFTS